MGTPIMPLLMLANVTSVAKGALFIPQPVGLWMMNSESEGKDVSGTGNDATPHDVTLTTGPMGEPYTAYRFHGRSTSYLSIANSPSMDVGANGSFTFTSFVWSEKNTAAFLEFVHASQPWCLHVWNWDNNLFVNMPERSPAPFQGKSSDFGKKLQITENTWHFIGVSYDMEQQRLLGVIDDKTDVQTFGGWPIETQSTEILLGTRRGQEAGYLLGEMSCAMLFSVSLSMDDIRRAKKYCMKKAKPFDSTFDDYGNGCIPAGYRLKELDAMSKLDCARDCQETDSCMSFSYNEVTKHCVLSNIDFVSGSVVPDVIDDDTVLYSVVFQN